VNYALIVSRVVVDKAAELHILSVRRGLSLEDAMRLLSQRPHGTVGRVQRMPADLPAPGDVLQLGAESRWQGMVTSTATRRERRLRDLGGRP
jgi:hypothetical protein